MYINIKIINKINDLPNKKEDSSSLKKELFLFCLTFINTVFINYFYDEFID